MSFNAPTSPVRRFKLGLLRLSAVAVLMTLVTILTLQPKAVPGVQAAGTTYYVATNGSDSNPGTSSKPWLTLQHATSTMSGGDTVIIRSGVYNVSKKASPISPPSGTASQNTILKAENPGGVTLQGSYPTTGEYPWEGIHIQGASYIRIEGLTIRGFHTGVSCKAPGHHITLENNTLEYNSEAGILSSGASSGSKNGCDYLTIEGNNVRYNGYRYDTGKPATGTDEGWSSGISIHPQSNPYWYDSNAERFHTVISRNTIYHNYDGTGGDSDNNADHTEGHGIILDRAGAHLPPILIENNVIYDNGGKCVCALGTQNIWIVGNTCYKNSTDALWLNPEDKAEIGAYETDSVPAINLHVLNNIAYALDGQRITHFPDSDADDSKQLEMRNNLWFGNPPSDPYSCPYGENPVCGDPMFVNPAGADFHLLARSQAIDTGTSDFTWPGMQLTLQLLDRDGTSRPQGAGYDIGAFESTATQEAPAPIAANFFVWLPYVLPSRASTCQW